MNRYSRPNTLPVYQTDNLHGICTLRLATATLNIKFPKRDRFAIADVISSMKLVVLDFSEVVAIDAAGLEMVVDWISESRSAGTRICFTHCGPAVLLNLQLLRVPKDVPILDSWQPAAEHFGVATFVKVQHAG